MIIASWDPGVTTGYAVFKLSEFAPEGFVIVKIGDCQEDELVSTWQEIEDSYGPITVAVVEDFRLFMKRARAQRNSNMPASKIIGKLEAMRDMSKGATRLVMQPASVKTMGMRYAGIDRMPSDHSKTHSLDAYVHGYFYGVKEGIFKTKLSTTKEAERG